VMHSMSSKGLVSNVFQGAKRMRLVRLDRDHAPPHSPVPQKLGKAAWSYSGSEDSTGLWKTPLARVEIFCTAKVNTGRGTIPAYLRSSDAG